MKISSSPVLLALAVSLLSSTAAFAQGDDFNDGDDLGWTRLAPLAGFGITTTFSFPEGNSYRIQCEAQNLNPQLGPPRGGSIREDVSYTDFYICVDISYNPGIDQNIGALARVREPGLGMLDGYAATYNPDDGDSGMLFISKITDEVTDGNLVEVVVPEQSGADLRLVFQGLGPELRLELFAMNDLETPVATATANDATYTMGNCGIFVVADPDSVPVDVTFDNYLALAAPPQDLKIVDVRIEDGQLEIDFLSKPLRKYSVDSSPDLTDWVNEVTDNVVGALSDRTTFSIALTPGRLYFRIREQ